MSRASLSIPPFPADINREYFGHYVSGFCDGEGSFVLGVAQPNSNHPSPLAMFSLNLRADDLPVLRLIQSYFNCGYLHLFRHKTPHRQGIKSNDGCYWRISSIPALALKLVPHFDRFPLYAKKRNDFKIWREAVLLIRQYQRLPRILKDPQGTRIWTADRLDHFMSLRAALMSGRKFNAPVVPLPPPPLSSEPTLFD